MSADVAGSRPFGPAAARDLALEPALAWLAVFLVFVGDLRVPVGGSELYLPLAVVPAAVLGTIRAVRGRLYVPFGALALAVVLAAGGLGAMAADDLAVRRVLAASFPVVCAIVVLCGLAGVDGLDRLARSAVLWGGALLSAWVISLSVQAFTSGLAFYDAKLLIETPLGRSNYLTAFLVACMGFAWGRAPAVALLAFAAIVASLSRGGLLIAFVFVGLTLLARWRLAVAAAALGCAAALAITAWLAFADLGLQQSHEQGGLLEGLTSLASATNRVVLWQAARDLLLESPVMGVGPNGFRSVVERLPDVEDVWGPHSAVLLLWLNYGLVGLVAYAAYLWALWSARARATAGARAAGPTPDAIGCALLALALFAMTEPLVGSASFEVLLAAVYAAALPPYPSTPSVPPGAPPHRP
jgi:O-antigen ligase